jgi:hypothetical protein
MKCMANMKLHSTSSLYIQHLFNRDICTKDSIRIVVALDYIIVIYVGLARANVRTLVYKEHRFRGN